MQEGLATGGGDFIFSVLPVGAKSTIDRHIEYFTQSASQDGHVGVIRSPDMPGDYLVTFLRNAEVPVNDTLGRFVVTFADRPEVTLIDPPAVAPGAAVPVTIAGGTGQPADRALGTG